MDILVHGQQLQVDDLNRQARKVWNDSAAQARDMAQQAQTLASETGYKKGLIDSQVIVAQCDLTAGLYEQAMESAAQALEFYETYSITDVWQLNVFYILGTAYMRLGDYTTALGWYQRLIQEAEVHRDTAYLALGLRNIGSLHAHQANYTEALYFLDQSIPYFEQLDTVSGLGSAYNNYSWIYGLSGNFNLALEYGYRSLALFENVGHLDGQSRANIVIADLQLKLGNDMRAMEHIESGKQIAETCGNVSSVANASMILSKIYLHRGQYERAIASFKDTLTQAETLQSKMMQLDCHEGLAACYRNLEDWKTALEHREQAVAIKDEIRTEDSIAKLRNLEVLYKTRQAHSAAEAQRRLREEDRRYYKQINQMKDEILNVASHDLKSPLVGIKLTVDSLRRHGRVDDERGQQLVSDIDTTIKQMGKLIVNVLDLAKLETGRALNTEMCDFGAFLEALFADMKNIAEQKHINLHLERPLPLVTLPFDPVRMSQVLQNLIFNAIKYTNKGGAITLSCHIDQHRLTVNVTDNGIGIPAYALPFVFERFYRVPDERHQTIEGTGLGLAIVKAIIEQHNGTIQAESEVGRGTTFRFTLPIDPTG
jgi:signal transduction histidine kinase